jgi:hypothetical protein
MAAERRTILLASGLVVVIIVAAVVWTSGGSGGGTAPSLPPRAPAARGPADQSAASQSMAHVNLEALAAERTEPTDSERNPFRFQARAPAPPPPVTTTLPAPRPVNPGAGPNGSASPQLPIGPPPPPPIPLKFIGIVKQGSTTVAVLSDGKSGPLPGKEGAIILGQYRILKIGNESIEMAYVDGRGRQTIRLTGQ